MPDERVVELCRLWWEKAQHDLQAAERLTDLPAICCFHCQQSVEKALKSALILHQIDFLRTHDIGLLLDLLQATSLFPSPPNVQDLVTLTRFAVSARYPPEEATSEEVEEALRSARALVDWMRETLPVHGI
jgi:HEPN domain-containing protein